MLNNLLLKNRSYRGFDQSKPMNRQQLEQLVSYARITPSSMNLQPLKFFLSAEQVTNEQIFPHTKWAGRLKQTLPKDGKHPTAYIVICVDTVIAPNVEVFLKDVGIVAQTMLLGATEMGFGGCMIGAFQADALAKAIRLPTNLTPLLVLALGAPDETVVLTEAVDGEIGYYRDDKDCHYVPKRSLTELIV